MAHKFLSKRKSQLGANTVYNGELHDRMDDIDIFGKFYKWLTYQEWKLPDDVNQAFLNKNE